MWSDPVVLRNYNYRPDWHSFDGFSDWFNSHPHAGCEHLNAAILTRSDPRLIGIVGLGTSTREAGARETDLAIIIHKADRSHAYGIEAIALAIEYAFTKLYAAEVTAGVYEHNAAAMHLVMKAGLTPSPEHDSLERSPWSNERVYQRAFTIKTENYKAENKKRNGY
jgi:RimJ/RimL family protein N-acetyltransferase